MSLSSQDSPQEAITIKSAPTPNPGTLSIIKGTSLELETRINSNSVIVGEVNIPLSLLDRSSGQNPMELTQNWMVFYVKETEKTATEYPTQTKTSAFYAAGQRRFSNTEHILGHKTHLNKFRKIFLRNPCILPKQFNKAKNQ